MTVATHEQQRDAVEAWARGLGFERGHGAPHEWSCFPNLHGGYTIYRTNEKGPTSVVSMPVALAWALLVELGAGSVDVGKCPACVKKFRLDPGADIWKSTVRPCVACKDSQREATPIARALLGDDAKVRACLYTEADRLLAANDPVGMALAWGLRWSEGDGNEDGTGEAAMLLHWAKVRREQETLAWFNRSVDALMLDDGRDAPNTIVLSPQAAVLLYSDPLPMPDPIPEHVNERARPKHARHIGQQLGRRLGVRAR
jgi:hypothetical protein